MFTYTISLRKGHSSIEAAGAKEGSIADPNEMAITMLGTLAAAYKAEQAALNPEKLELYRQKLPIEERSTFTKSHAEQLAIDLLSVFSNSETLSSLSASQKLAEVLPHLLGLALEMNSEDLRTLLNEHKLETLAALVGSPQDFAARIHEATEDYSIEEKAALSADIIEKIFSIKFSYASKLEDESEEPIVEPSDSLGAQFSSLPFSIDTSHGSAQFLSNQLKELRNSNPSEEKVAEIATLLAGHRSEVFKNWTLSKEILEILASLPAPKPTPENAIFRAELWYLRALHKTEFTASTMGRKHPETGIAGYYSYHIGDSASSIYAVFTGREKYFKKLYAPSDLSDVGRCVDFLLQVPEARIALSRLAELSPQWQTKVENWSSLESEYLAQNK